MASLTIKLLGVPQVALDGSPLHLEGRIPLALLAYLAVTGQLHTRDALAALFWPEAGQPRTQLRNNLWVINQALGPWGKRWLYSDHETIGLQPGVDLWLDVAHFQAQLATVRAHGCAENALCAACLAHLNAAVDLYQDDFLAGFTLRASPVFDEWQFFQSEQLRQQLADALETLAQHQQQQGAWEMAILYARRRLALDPLHEPAHRHLMTLYAGSGQQSAALRQYQTCTRLLQAELGVQPEPATADLYAQIRKGAVMRQLTGSPTSQQPVIAVQDRPSNNLLEQLTPLIGRTGERTSLQKLLGGTARLVTLTGTGGIGKTRLALQVAADLLENFADGAYFVPLAPIREASLVLMAVAQTLGVRETGSRELLESVVGHLHAKALLLVLDNFEHVVSAAPLVTDLLARCPRLKILVTSREVLHLRGEHEYSVPALAVPTSHQLPLLATLAQYAAVQLFIERAQTVKPDFAVDNVSAPAVAEICVRLDGLPLAIELAAARCKFFSLQLLLQKLTTSTLATLRGGARDMPERHQTLRNAIAWSYDLLNTAERKLFQQLAVFVGGFTLEAAVQVCTWESEAESDGVQAGLLSLVDKSLVRQELGADGEARFLLLETVREFALERLQESGELVITQQRHVNYYAELAHVLCPQVIGLDSVRVVAQIRTEFPNIRVALQWLLAQHRVDHSLRLCSALLQYWRMVSSREAIVFLEAALTLAADHPPTPAHVNALASAGFMSFTLDAKDSGQHYFEQCLTLNKLIGNLGDPKYIGAANGLLGWIMFDQGQYPAARAYLAAAKENDLASGDEWALAMTLANQGKMATKLGEFALAHTLLAEALIRHRWIGDAWGIALTLLNQSFAFLLQKRFAEAAAIVAQSQPICEEIQAEGLLVEVYYHSTLIAFHRNEQSRAALLLREALLIRQKAATPRYLLEVLETAILIAVGQNERHRGLVLASAISAYRTREHLVAPPVEKTLVDDAVALARQQLTLLDSATAWAAGEAMTLDEAVTYAITVLRTYTD